ncbi:MAG: elongation factor P maturation arginine rhamnosyltransferase EarP [Sulfuriferula sp.]
MRRWDIFCAVIDNYGDVAVSWRLARQLAAEQGMTVRLWVDDLRPLSALCPGIDPLQAQQTSHGVDIRFWGQPFPAVDIADIVIEAFACELPAGYVAAMATSQVKPHWLNLEYLSAENWVAECHGLPSPHPPLLKHFFFPGFTPRTGGLIRESGLIEQRNTFQASAVMQAEFWRQLDCTPTASALKVSLFGYENSALPNLLQAWSVNPTPVWCALPQNCLTAATGAWFGAGKAWQRGNLTIQPLPFLSQDGYDQLLWACDLNFVRGEDSFVRALWANRPLAWHIYPQKDAAHHAKLQAFLDLYQQGLHAQDAEVLREFWQGWNHLHNRPLNWQAWQAIHSTLRRHHEDWLARLTSQTDLAMNLVKFTSIG